MFRLFKVASYALFTYSVYEFLMGIMEDQKEDQGGDADRSRPAAGDQAPGEPVISS